jgi:hypothetical protein
MMMMMSGPLEVFTVLFTSAGKQFLLQTVWQREFLLTELTQMMSHW